MRLRNAKGCDSSSKWDHDKKDAGGRDLWLLPAIAIFTAIDMAGFGWIVRRLVMYGCVLTLMYALYAIRRYHFRRFASKRLSYLLVGHGIWIIQLAMISKWMITNGPSEGRVVYMVMILEAWCCFWWLTRT